MYNERDSPFYFFLTFDKIPLFFCTLKLTFQSSLILASAYKLVYPITTLPVSVVIKYIICLLLITKKSSRSVLYPHKLFLGSLYVKIFTINSSPVVPVYFI